jgi:hypothetical protein
MNGVVTNNKDEKKATVSSYIDLTNRNHAITARSINKMTVNLAENTETPKMA